MFRGFDLKYEFVVKVIRLKVRNIFSTLTKIKMNQNITVLNKNIYCHMNIQVMLII